MAAINQEDLIGSIVPDVYISRITLESSGTPLKEDNPHIDHERERISQRPEKNADALIVKIDFVLKEKLNNDVIGTWFANQDIGKYLEVKIFQSTDPELTSYLSIGSDAIELIDPRKNIGSRDIRFRLASKILRTTNVRDTLQRVKRRSDFRIVSVKKDVEGNDSKLSQFKSRVDDDGNVVYDITYRAQFDIPKSDPQHLAYFAVSSFDVVQLARDFDLELDRSTLRDINGKITSEVVIDDHAVVSRSFIFYDSEGKIWAGPVHQAENGQWFSKSRPQEGSVPLTRTVVTNSKVQDFRNVKEIERLTIDFSVIEKEIFSKNLTKRLSNDVIESKREESYFSDMYLARDQDGDAKFFFSLDLEKAIAENALFGRLMKRNKKGRLRRELIAGSQIRAMRVYRRRVKEDGSLTRAGTPKGLSPFDNNEPWELVANSGEKTWKSFATVNNSVGSLREFDLATTEDLIGVRHFSGMDKTMSDVTDGVYQYIVEAEVDDATVEFVEEKIAQLLDAKSELEAYLSLGSQQSMSKYLAEVRDPHIDSPSEFAGTQGSTSGTYDPVSNRFTDYFINIMERKYGRNRRRLNAPWISAVVVYANVLDLFTGALGSRSNRYKIMNSLYSYTSPRTGNPSGVSAVIKLIDNLVSVLARSIGTTITTSPRKFAPGSSQRSAAHSLSRSPKRTFKISRAFDSIFDSEVIKGAGVDYLSRGEDETDNDDGLRVMRADDYIKRVELETLRYYKTVDPDINLSYAGETITDGDRINATSYTYFTPARIDLPKESVVLMEGALSQKLDDSFPQNSPRVPFKRRKRKKKRAVRKVDEGKTQREDDLVQLQTAITYQSSVEVPVTPRLNRNVTGGKLRGGTATGGRKRRDPVKAGKESTFNSFKDLGSLLNIDLRPIKIKPVKDEDDNVLIEVEPEIELVPEIVTECQTPDGRVEEPEDNRDDLNDLELESLSSLMSTIMYPSVQNGNFRRRKRWTRKPNFRASKGPQSFRRRDFSSLAGLMSVRNLKVTRVEEGRRGTTRIIQGLNRELTEKDFKLFPNQLKAIFLQSTAGDIVKRNRFANLKATSINDRTRAQADINFSYQMINQVVYLEGFQTDDEGNVLIREPIWTELTEEKYNTLIGQSILCRMKSYENETLGLKRNKGMEMAVYDEYFLLVPNKVKRKLPSRPITFNPGALTGKIIDDIRKLLPDVNIEQVTRDRPIITDLKDDQERGMINVPVRIAIVETNSDGKKFERAYDLSDTSALAAVLGNTQDVKVGNRQVSVPKQLTAEIIAMDTQSRNVETEFTSNNFVSSKTIMEGIEEAARLEGMDVVALKEGIATVDMQVTDAPLASGVLSVQVERNEVVPFEQAFAVGSGGAIQSATTTTPSSSEAVLQSKTKTSPRKRTRKTSRRR